MVLMNLENSLAHRKVHTDFKPFDPAREDKQAPFCVLNAAKNRSQTPT